MQILVELRWSTLNSRLNCRLNWSRPRRCWGGLMTPRCRRPRVSSLFRCVMSLPAARSIKSCAPTVFFSFHRGGARSNSTPVVHEFGIALPRGLTLVCYRSRVEFTARWIKLLRAEEWFDFPISISIIIKMDFRSIWRIEGNVKKCSKRT